MSMRHYRMLLRRAFLLKWARPAVQMIFKLFAELFHESHGGHRGGIAERTECLPQHVLRQVVNVVDVFLRSTA